MAPGGLSLLALAFLQNKYFGGLFFREPLEAPKEAPKTSGFYDIRRDITGQQKKKKP
jgi:hypothetical protein